MDTKQPLIKIGTGVHFRR